MSTATRNTTVAHGLRAWQVTALDAMDSWTEGSFLMNAAPGAGKTRPALEYARRALASR